MIKNYYSYLLTIAASWQCLFAIVSPLPSWTTAPALTLWGMPPLQSWEMAKSCQNNTFKNDAVLFIQQSRYITSVQGYLQEVMWDINQRSSYIQQLQGMITARKQDVAYLQQMIQDDSQKLQNVQQQLNQASTSIAQLQTQLTSSPLTQLIQQATTDFSQAQQQLSQQTAQHAQLTAQIQKITPADQQRITYTLQWIQFHQENDQALIGSYQNYVNDITNNPAYKSWKAYLPTYTNMLKALQTAQPIAASSQAQALLDAAAGTTYQTSYKTTAGPINSSATMQQYEKLYVTKELSITDIQDALDDLQTLVKYSKLAAQITTLTNSLPGQLDVLSKGFNDQMQDELDAYNNAIAQANFYVTQKNYFAQKISAHKAMINQLNNEINQLVGQIQQVSTAISTSLVPAINNVQQVITQLAHALQNPPKGMFAACPYFLQSLLNT